MKIYFSRVKSFDVTTTYFSGTAPACVSLTTRRSAWSLLPSADQQKQINRNKNLSDFFSTNRSPFVSHDQDDRLFHTVKDSSNVCRVNCFAKHGWTENSEVKPMVQQKNKFRIRIVIFCSCDRESQYSELNASCRNVFRDKRRVFHIYDCLFVYRIVRSVVHCIELRRQNERPVREVDVLSVNLPKENRQILLVHSSRSIDIPTVSIDTGFNVKLSRVNSQFNNKICRSVNLSNTDRKTRTGGRRKTCVWKVWFKFKFSFKNEK